MPVNHQKPESLEMDSDMSPSSKLSDLSRGGSLESRSSSSRSRSFTLDDESLKYLTHEEKDVILFFEETLGSLEDDFDEQALCDSGIHCHSPQSLEESPASQSEPEDVIDLVQLGPAAGEAEDLPDGPLGAGPQPVGKEGLAGLEGGKQAKNCSDPDPRALEALPPAQSPESSTPKRDPPPPPTEHPKLARSVPTPLVIAQQMSEKLAGGEALSPTSPRKEGRTPGEWRTPATQPVPKVHRFPSNISVSNSAGRDFHRTLSRAAVSVQERRAQVLAHIRGASALAAGDLEARGPGDAVGPGDAARPVDAARPGPGDTAGPGDAARPGDAAGPRSGVGGQAASQQSLAVQTEQPTRLACGFQSAHDALRSHPSAFVPTGKTVVFRADPAGRLARQNACRSLCEPHRDCAQDARRRAGSLPRATGFRPQGITVQFSGRGSTEEARREALRKLGLLKETL